MSDLDPTVPVYPIGVVQKLTGLSGRQIRYYEQVGLVEPQRTQGNQRLYAPENVDVLLRIKELLAEGLNIEGVRARLAKADTRSVPRETAESTAREQRIDHAHILGQMRAGQRLASLFPVNNQAALVEVLHARRQARLEEPSGDRPSKKE